MKITILTMFPELFGSFLEGPIVKRAAQRGIAEIRLVDIKEYAGGCYRHIDDSTFGGGAGMVMRAEPILKALDAAVCGEQSSRDTISDEDETDILSGPDWKGERGRSAESERENPPGRLVAALTPAGVPYCQDTAKRYAHLDHLILICGHYEGMDERVYSRVDERISIGDYILSGGEPAAQVVADSVIRLLPGILRPESTQRESFCGRGFLEYPQYTRPADLNGEKVPDILLTGNHEAIRRFRLKESLRLTMEYRPDLLEGRLLTREEQEMLDEIRTSER